MPDKKTPPRVGRTHAYRPQALSPVGHLGEPMKGHATITAWALWHPFHGKFVARRSSAVPGRHTTNVELADRLSLTLHPMNIRIWATQAAAKAGKSTISFEPIICADILVPTQVHMAMTATWSDR